MAELTQSRVQPVAQPAADEIERHDREEDGQPGEGTPAPKKPREAITTVVVVTPATM